MFLLLGSIADEESVNLFFMSKAGGGGERDEAADGWRDGRGPLKRCFQRDV